MNNGLVETTLNSPSGAHIHLFSRMPERGVKAAVHVNHGMAEHAARYARFAHALTKRGYAFFAHDHRGHGKTTAPDAPKGVFGKTRGFEKVIEDVHAVNSHIRARDHDVPVVCFGHSMGSAIALNYALRHPERVDGLACWNLGAENGLLARIGRLVLRAEAKYRGTDVASAVAPKLTFDAWNRVFKPNRTEFDWLSRDEQEVDLYVNDPDCGFPVSTGLWLDVLDAVAYASQRQRLSVLAKGLPIHILGGEQDPCSNRGRDMEKLAKRFHEAGFRDVTGQIMPESRHETLNEVNREDATMSFVNWLEARY